MSKIKKEGKKKEQRIESDYSDFFTQFLSKRQKNYTKKM